MARRDYTGGAVATTITGAIDAVATTITIASATGWPSGTNGKFLVAIDRGLSSEEKMLVLSRTLTTLTLAGTGDRGLDGTSAQSHSSGAVIEHVAGAIDLDDSNAHINDTTRNDHTQYYRKTTAEGAGLVQNGVALDVNTDNTTLEVVTDQVRIKNAGVTSAKLAANAVTTTAITDANVTLAKLADSSVSSAKIVDATIATGDLADQAVTSAKIADGTIAVADMAGAFWTALATSGSAPASAPLTVTAVGNPAATPQTIGGTQHTLTPARVGEVFMFFGTIDISYTGGATQQEAVVALSIDGSSSLTSPQIIGVGKINGVLFRVCVSQTWLYTAVDTSSHTFSLKAYKLNAGDTVLINQTHTHLDYIRLG